MEAALAASLVRRATTIPGAPGAGLGLITGRPHWQLRLSYVELVAVLGDILLGSLGDLSLKYQSCYATPSHHPSPPPGPQLVLDPGISPTQWGNV
eukprot:2082149-Pyramimonas_sp.AAC.1